MCSGFLLVALPAPDADGNSLQRSNGKKRSCKNWIASVPEIPEVWIRLGDPHRSPRVLKPIRAYFESGLPKTPDPVPNMTGLFRGFFDPISRIIVIIVSFALNMVLTRFKTGLFKPVSTGDLPAGQYRTIGALICQPIPAHHLHHPSAQPSATTHALPRPLF